MTTDDDVEVKFAGVDTDIVLPESVRVDVAALLTVTEDVVAEVGVAFPAQPIVVNRAELDVA